MDSKNSSLDEELRLRELLKRRQAAARQQVDAGSTNTDSDLGGSNPQQGNNAATSGPSQPTQHDKTKPQHHKEASADRSGGTSSRGRGFSSESSSRGRLEQSPVARSSGKKRKRERRRMNRQAQRRGAPQNHRSRGHDNREQSFGFAGAAYRDHRDRAPYPDWRGPPPSHRRSEYDYSEYRRRGRSPRRSHSQSRPRTPSSVSSQSDVSRSRSRSDSRDRHRRSRSRGSDMESQNRTTSRGRRRSHGSGSRHRDDDRGSFRDDDRRGESSGRYSRDRYGRHRRYKRRRNPPNRRRSYSSSSYSDSSPSSSEDEQEAHQDESAFSKDQRTVFVTQLVLRATEKDIRRYFRRKVGCKVKEVILLKDKRTGNHKGCAYVEMGRINDVNKAVSVAGQPPDFQRFPILVKASEAEKNYSIPASSSVVTASMMGNATSEPTISKDGKVVESQKAYVGSLDPSVNESHLFSLFSEFGELQKVSMQMDPTTQTSRGYAFLSFRDPKEANLAIQTMSNQVLAGRPMKTGWANQSSSIPGVTLDTSDDMPSDATERAQKALARLAELTGSSSSGADVSAAISATAIKAIDAAMGGATESSAQSDHAAETTAQSKASLAAEQSSQSTAEKSHTVATSAASSETKASNIRGDEPTQFILVHNMFDKDEETEVGWEKDIKEEFEDECSKFGKITSVVVLSNEVGGKIYAAFEKVEAAELCATNLSGRWFDKRQLRVDYIEEAHFPKQD